MNGTAALVTVWDCQEARNPLRPLALDLLNSERLISLAYP